MQAISKAELSYSSPDRAMHGASGDLAVIGDTKPATTHTANVHGVDGKGAKVRAMLRARLGDDVYSSWFTTLEFDGFDGKTVTVSVPVKFLRKWIDEHYKDELLKCCRLEFKTAESIEVVVRQPGAGAQRSAGREAEPAKPRDTGFDQRAMGVVEPPRMPVARPVAGRTSIDGFEGSPLDPHHTFENFVVGA
ncbi:MAG: DnaA N-terminal domain-containing protein, partial [Hyphomicrobium sp.]|uniref:DnaA N-terminal domain-containing protein n=1 Tax=Hyphomicrobium sp. TaxID=82 RepID=UPI003D14B128